jgi:hypothetical protein
MDPQIYKLTGKQTDKWSNRCTLTGRQMGGQIYRLTGRKAKIDRQTDKNSQTVV